jgi:nitronate monooxygenase
MLLPTVIQAPLAGVQGSALAIAVCNAGGLGSLPAAMLGPDALAAELRAIRAGTSAAFNVNFFCHAPPVPDRAREEAWRAALATFYRELGLEPTVSAVTRRPFDHATADILESDPPPFLSFHFGLPPEDLLARIRPWDVRILATATTPDEARWLVARGVHAVIAQGVEAGGHRGNFLGEANDLTTMALIPQLLGEVPVIAAGGIGSPGAVRAALDLGAAAVQIGTAYLLCPEATTSPVHRAALRAGLPTAVTNLFTGRPARGIVNRLMSELGPMSALPPDFPLAAAALAPLRAAAEATGSGDFSPLWSGSAGAREGLGAAELTRALAGALDG